MTGVAGQCESADYRVPGRGGLTVPSVSVAGLPKNEGRAIEYFSEVVPERINGRGMSATTAERGLEEPKWS